MSDFLSVLAIAPYLLGALAFSALAISYWTEGGAARRGVLPAFTAVCAVALLLNLARFLGAPEFVGLAQEVEHQRG